MKSTVSIHIELTPRELDQLRNAVRYAKDRERSDGNKERPMTQLWRALEHEESMSPADLAEQYRAEDASAALEKRGAK